MKSGIEIFIIAAALAGCVVSGGNQESMVPAGGSALTYNARTNAEYDAGKVQANDWCQAHQGVPARYVARTADAVRFECVSE